MIITQTLRQTLYPIVDSVPALTRALALGFQWIQFRQKTLNKEGLHTLLQALQENRPAEQQYIFLNDAVDLLTAIDSDRNHAIHQLIAGVHLGQSDLKLHATSLHKLDRNRFQLGISTHNPHEVELALQFNPDYLAFGSLFHSPSKPQLTPVASQRLDDLRQLCAQVELPVVAIGGIGPETINAALNAGAERAASISWAQQLLASCP